VDYVVLQLERGDLVRIEAQPGVASSQTIKARICGLDRPPIVMEWRESACRLGGVIRSDQRHGKRNAELLLAQSQHQSQDQPPAPIVVGAPSVRLERRYTLSIKVEHGPVYGSARSAGKASGVPERQDVGKVILDRLVELLVRARVRLAVGSPADELRSMSEADALHVFIPHFDNPLGT